MTKKSRTKKVKTDINPVKVKPIKTKKSFKKLFATQIKIEVEKKLGKKTKELKNKVDTLTTNNTSLVSERDNLKLDLIGLNRASEKIDNWLKKVEVIAVNFAKITRGLVILGFIFGFVLSSRLLINYLK